MAPTGLNLVTMQPPIAAIATPSQNNFGTDPIPAAGGSVKIEIKALTTGAPAKIMAMTTAGWPLAPKANNTPNAPIAPTIPAINDQAIPLPDMDQLAPLTVRTSIGAATAVTKYAIPTHKKA